MVRGVAITALQALRALSASAARIPAILEEHLRAPESGSGKEHQVVQTELWIKRVNAPVRSAPHERALEPRKTTSTRTTTIPVSVLAALTLALGPLSAQDPEVLPIRDRQHQHPPTGSMGMLMDESGGWREATVEEAFALLRLAPDPQLEMLVGAGSVATPARVTIRQVHRDLPGSVLDGLIRDLKETVLDFSAPEEVRGNAISVLAAAAKDSRFSSYGKQAPGAFEPKSPDPEGTPSGANGSGSETIFQSRRHLRATPPPTSPAATTGGVKVQAGRPRYPYVGG